MQVVSVDSQLTQNGIKCVVYGRSGVGKTRLALTVPAPLVLSAEKGLLSIRGNNIAMLPEIKTLKELIDAHNWILNDRAAQQYQTIVVDSITEIAEVVLRASKIDKKDGRQAHDQASELIINTVFRNFRDLPRKHIVMLAKERSVENQYDKTTQFIADMPNGKLRTALPHYFDFVFRYFNGVDPATGNRFAALQTFADASADAKDRSGRLAPYELPHLGNVFAKAMQ